MNTSEAKGILEAALLTAQAPLSVAELRRLFEDRIGADTIRALLDELRADWIGRTVELVALSSGWRFLSRPEFWRVSGETQSRSHPALFARGT